ncbi:MAG: PIG-L family deacetylase [Burkholderiales bacterium]|nr:PIG-L family deacetylase [Burkholderiales bacterium]
MPTDPPACAVFLFAHQDDEFGVFQRIEQERRMGRRVWCIYFTGVGSARRNRESLAVLQHLGVAGADVVFAGEGLGIGDAQLLQQLPAAVQWLRDWLAQHQPDSVYVPAWEGGHPDHDSLHAMVAHLAPANAWQFSLYNAWLRPAPLFRVLAPLPANGPATCERIPWRDRLRYLRLCLCYPSQATSWLGLFPFVLLHYLLHGTQCVQPVDAGRVRERPHEGTLYYEARRFQTWEAVSARLRELGLA